MREITKEEVFRSAQTLNSLEKCDREKRERLASEYSDYIIMHRTYSTYAANMQDDDPLRQIIKDFGKMPINVKPSKIRDYHHKLNRIVGIMRHSDMITKYSAAISDRYEKESGNTEYTDGNYSMLMPKGAEDIVQEGRELQHCVGNGGYIQQMAAGGCTILFLRVSKNLQDPFITIEVRDGVITQCYGFRDSYNRDPKIRDFIKDYAALHGLEIKTVIYSEGK